MAAQVRQVIAQGGGVVAHHAQLRVREAVECEDRHEAAPERPECGRKAVRAHQAEQEATREEPVEVHPTSPPARAILRRRSPESPGAPAPDEVRTQSSATSIICLLNSRLKSEMPPTGSPE